MADDSSGGQKAMEQLEQIVKAAGYPAEDPGLRNRFHELPRAPIRLICCGLDKGINHGNILRIAECFRLEEVCFSPVGRRKEKDYSGGFAALKWQPFVWEEPIDAIRRMKASGHRIYAMALEESSIPLQSVRWQHPCAIVLGQEMVGIDAEVQAECDELIAIPIFGMVQSMNVAVSAGIAVSHCFDAFAGANPDFLPARRLSQVMLSHRNSNSKL